MDEDILKRAAAVIADHNLCNQCVGRLFLDMDASNNEERGRKIRKALHKKEPERCELCEGFFKTIMDVAWRAARELGSTDARTITVSSVTPKRTLELEEEIWENYDIKLSESIKKDVNRSMREKLRDIGGWKYDPERPDARVTVNLNGSVSVETTPVYITAKIIAQPAPKGETRKRLATVAEAILGSSAVRIRSKHWKIGANIIIEIQNPVRRHIPLKTIKTTLRDSGINYIQLRETVGAECARRYLGGQEC